MLSSVVKSPRELLIDALVMARAWRQLDVLHRNFSVCAQVYIVKPGLFSSFVVLFIRVWRWSLFTSFYLCMKHKML